MLQTSTFIYIVTEYAKNGEIFDYLVNKGKMSEKVCKEQLVNVFLYIYFGYNVR